MRPFDHSKQVSLLQMSWSKSMNNSTINKVPMQSQTTNLDFVFNITTNANLKANAVSTMAIAQVCPNHYRFVDGPLDLRSSMLDVK